MIAMWLRSGLIAIGLFVAALPLAAAGQKQRDVDTVPCNPQASADTRAVMQYLATLSSGHSGQAIVGQNCFHGDQITDENSLQGYSRLIGKLHEETGQWVGMVSIDYEFEQMFTPAQLSAANKKLIEHWRRGGLVTINLSPINPWMLSETEGPRAPTRWDGPGSPFDRSKVHMADLVDTTEPVAANWQAKLDRIADALTELRDAGVVVLWRPMQENNGNWFWWGGDVGGFVKVYRDMYRYFTEVRKLDNLLWVYSPSAAVKNYQTYPGDDVVDVVAPTCYSDDFHMDSNSYWELSSLGNPLKPMGLAEYGPKLGGPNAAAGTLDTRGYISAIVKDYPRIAYWVCWHSYPGENWSLVTNKHYDELLNNPSVLTIDRLNWRAASTNP